MQDYPKSLIIEIMNSDTESVIYIISTEKKLCNVVVF